MGGELFNAMHLNRWLQKLEDSATMKITIIFIMFILVDFLYIYSFGNYFNSMIRDIQGSSIEMNTQFFVGCFAVYNVLALAMYYFIILPNKGIGYAFFLGLIIYGSFDFTNYAMFKKYKWQIAVTDMLWGGILFSIVYTLSRHLIF
jgi:uncharacterized membrane protein